MALLSDSWFWGKHFIWYCSGAQRIYKFFRYFLKHSLKFWVLLFTLHWGLHTVQYTLGSFLHFQLMMWRLSDSQRGRVAKFCFRPGIVPGGRPFLAGDRMAGPQGWLTVKTLPKTQRTRGLSSNHQSYFFRSYHKSLHKFWSNIFRISTKHQLQISTKHQHFDKT